MRKRRTPSTAFPKFYDFSSSLVDHRVHILTEAGRAAFATQFATADDVSAALGVSRATAYRYMRQLPCWYVIDQSDGEERTYQAIELRQLSLIKRGQRGNPKFRSSEYQRKLAQRPRKTRLTR